MKEFFVDYINKKIHLLDYGRTPQEQLVNVISPDYQKRFIETQNLLQDVLEFEWICYGSDGIIASYSNYNFTILSPKLPYLHTPYKKVCETRRKRT